MVYPGQRPPPADWGRAPPPPMAPPERFTTIGHITVPILLVMTFVPFLVFVTYQGTRVIEGLSSQFENMDQRHNSHVILLSRQLEELRADVRDLSMSMISRQQHEVWCGRTERINKDWRCGEYPALPSGYYNPLPEPIPMSPIQVK